MVGRCIFSIEIVPVSGTFVIFWGGLFIVYPLRINVNDSDIYLFLYARTTKVPAGFQAPLMLAYGCRIWGNPIPEGPHKNYDLILEMV